MYISKSLQETVCRLTLDIQTRYVAASAVTDTNTHMTTITFAHAPRLNKIGSVREFAHTYTRRFQYGPWLEST